MRSMDTPIHIFRASDDLRIKLERYAQLLVETDAVFAEIQKLRDFLELAAHYAGDSTSQSVSLNETYRHSGREEFSANFAYGRRSKRDKIISACHLILQDGKPRDTRVLLDELSRLKVEVSGNENAAQNLSAYLSKEKTLFKSDRRLGWSLVIENPDSALTLPGLSVENAVIFNSPGEAPPAGIAAEKG